MRRKLVLALTGLFMCLAPVRGLTTPMPVGVVAGLEGPAKAVQVIHGQESFSPQVGFLLYAGDRVAVASPGARVEVSLFDGRPPLAINKDNAGIQGVITAGNAPPTIMDNLLQWLARRLPRQNRQQMTATLLASRGDDELILSSTGEGEQQVAAGKRDWIVAWRGGNGPYALRLVRQEAGKSILVAERTDLKESRSIITGIDALPGKYRLEVMDKHQKAGCDLVVVPQSMRLEMPGEIASTGYPAEFKNLLYIAWLYRRPGWQFEAMQQAARASRNDAEAANVLWAMEHGIGDYLD